MNTVMSKNEKTIETLIDDFSEETLAELSNNEGGDES
jgi:hypothetical protein